MSQRLFYDHIASYIPDMTQAKAILIADYWRGFWENPGQFKETDLAKIISAWVETEVGKYELDICGALVRKKGE